MVGTGDTGEAAGEGALCPAHLSDGGWLDVVGACAGWGGNQQPQPLPLVCPRRSLSPRVCPAVRELVVLVGGQGTTGLSSHPLSVSRTSEATCCWCERLSPGRWCDPRKVSLFSILFSDFLSVFSLYGMLCWEGSILSLGALPLRGQLSTSLGQKNKGKARTICLWKRRKTGEQHKSKENRTAFPLSIWTSQGEKEHFSSHFFPLENKSKCHLVLLALSQIHGKLRSKNK